MRTPRLAFDPLWQCLCPQWNQPVQRLPFSASTRVSRPALEGLKNETRRVFAQNATRQLSTTTSKGQQDAPIAVDDETAGSNGSVLEGQRSKPPFELDEQLGSPVRRSDAAQERSSRAANQLATRPNASTHLLPQDRASKEPPFSPRYSFQNLERSSIAQVYGLLRNCAYEGYVREARNVAEYLVKVRKVRPNPQIYNCLIAANVSPEYGSAYRVQCLLEEMEKAGMHMDNGTCHAVLKVVSVHLDHLLRSDVLEYMKARWFQLTEDGRHDVTAGLLREGRLEQAMDMLDKMRTDAIKIEPWLLDMAAYALCEAEELDEAHRLMRSRFDSGEPLIPRNLWAHLLETASSVRHHGATHLAWTAQVRASYLNPSSGTCFNVLATACHAGDPMLATEVFSHLSKRGTPFQRSHYELLISTYLSGPDPDLRRALSILTIMPLENLQPTTNTTRALYHHLKTNPDDLSIAFQILTDLHSQDRPIPIAALNLLLEVYVENSNLPSALKLYKTLHTFAPPSTKPGSPRHTLATIETFNLLLRGCRRASPPDASQASFLVSELLELRIKPNPLTYDRLILVFIAAGRHALTLATTPKPSSTPPTPPTTTSPALHSSPHLAEATTHLHFAHRHLMDMISPPLNWYPRIGTLMDLAKNLALLGDERCWDVLQLCEEKGRTGEVEGWQPGRERWVREGVEESWARGRALVEGLEKGGADEEAS